MQERGHVFRKDELRDILKAVEGKTLGEVDRNNVFYKTIKHPKITGIAGSVVEESVLGYPADSYQRPDLYVDGEDVEVKTTGLRRVKKSVDGELEAKEPMSITAVAPEKIIYENFETSNFWHKLERLLLVYYLYDSEVTVPASEYARFPIVGYDFHEFNPVDRERLKNDWEIVRDFIYELQSDYVNPEEQYPRISSELRSQLMLIDTAPKWPNRPRFRLKRTTVTTMAQKLLGKKFENLKQEINTYEELDYQLNQFTKQYRNKSIQELLELLEITVKLNSSGDVSKSVTEQIVTRMFGAKSKKIGKIELFSEIGLIAKTITQTKQGTRTEDTKLFKVDFDEWLDENISFEDSSLYSNFSERQFLFIVFQEQDKSEKLLTNRFLGFKRVIFKEEFIGNRVKFIWDDVRNKVFNNILSEEVMLDSNGRPTINKNGTVKTSINFPKSKDCDVFFRGTGKDSRDKTIIINGISMYRQDVWIKGSTINQMLNSVDFI